jgi:hypothetical protein
MRHPEASHANCKAFPRGFREAEGSAPLHPWAIPDCWMIGCPEQQSRSFASHPEHGKKESMVLGSGWHIHEDRDW